MPLTAYDDASLIANVKDDKIDYVSVHTNAVVFSIYTKEQRSDYAEYRTKKGAENRAAKDASWVSSFDREHAGRGHTNYLTVEERWVEKGGPLGRTKVFFVVWVIAPYTVPVVATTSVEDYATKAHEVGERIEKAEADAHAAAAGRDWYALAAAAREGLETQQALEKISDRYQAEHGEILSVYVVERFRRR